MEKGEPKAGFTRHPPLASHRQRESSRTTRRQISRYSTKIVCGLKMSQMIKCATFKDRECPTSGERDLGQLNIRRRLHAICLITALDTGQSRYAPSQNKDPPNTSNTIPIEEPLLLTLRMAWPWVADADLRLHNSKTYGRILHQAKFLRYH